MKKFALFLVLLSVVFVGSYSAAKGAKLDWKRRPGPRVDRVDARFVPNPFPVQNRFFTVVIIGRNNGGSVEKTLASVFSQNYENYRVVYIDDASDDGSFDLASDLIADSGQSMRVAYVTNEERMGELANLSRAVETCGNDEIVVLLKGEDWLAHEWVLQRLNAYYADPDLWIAAGKYCEYPSYAIGGPIFLSGDIRKDLSVSPHLKTFYAGLFKKVQTPEEKNLGELDYMIPMLEMAGAHSFSIPEVLIIANSEGVEKSPVSEPLARSARAYLPLTALFSERIDAEDEWIEEEMQ